MTHPHTGRTSPSNESYGQVFASISAGCCNGA